MQAVEYRHRSRFAGVMPSAALHNLLRIDQVVEGAHHNAVNTFGRDSNPGSSVRPRDGHDGANRVHAICFDADTSGPVGAVADRHAPEHNNDAGARH
jgi:hypothetical protein